MGRPRSRYFLTSDQIVSTVQDELPSGRSFNRIFRGVAFFGKDIENCSSDIKMPLSLAALALIIFYLLFNAVLRLNVFSDLNEGHTYELLQALLGFVFWLAIATLLVVFASLFLTACLYKVQKISRRNSLIGSKQKSIKFRSRGISLINEKQMSDVSLRLGGDTAAFRRHPFPVVDFKFRNTGMANSLLRSFVIDIQSIEVDQTPALRFDWALGPLSSSKRLAFHGRSNLAITNPSKSARYARLNCAARTWVGGPLWALP